MSLQEKYGEMYKQDNERRLSQMKDFIKRAGLMKKQISERNSSAEVKLKVSKARSEMFLMQEVESSMKDLLEVFNIELTSRNDEEIA